MKQLLTTLSLILTVAAASLAQAVLPFDVAAKGKYYAVFGPQEQTDITTNTYIPALPSKLYEVDAASGALSKIGEGDMGVHVNGLAYNSVDNFLYGIVDTTSGSFAPPSVRQQAVMYRIGKNAQLLRIGQIKPPVTAPSDVTSAIFSFVGDMDAAGNYYFPAIVVHSYSIAPSAIDYDLFIGRIAQRDLVDSKPEISATYTLMRKGNCSALIDAYVLAYCRAILLGTPRPNGGIQDWAINPYDGKLWSYIADDKQFFSVPLPDAASPTTPVDIVCTPAPVGYPDLTSSEFGAIFFTPRGDMIGIDPDNGRYYAFDNCTNNTFCNNLTLVREYTQAFGNPAFPTFLNLRADGASTLHGPITPTDEPFAGCTGSQFSLFSESDKIVAGNYSYPSNAKLYSVDPSTGAINQISVNDTGKRLDGLAFNAADRFLYATSDSTWADFATGTPILQENAALYRLDNAGFVKKVQNVKRPGTNGSEQSVILAQAADMDADGNYYFLAAVVGKVNAAAPFVTGGYTLYIGKINGATIKNPSLPLASALSPTYYKLNLTDCAGLFDRYLEEYIGAVVTGTVRPRTGVQDWAINPKDKRLWSYLASENRFFIVPLPDAANPSVEGICAPIDPSLAMLGSSPSAQAAFYGNDGKSLFLTDATNGVFYQLDNCSDVSCLGISPITTYSIAFSATKPDFRNLISDGASCTFASIDCDASAYHILSPVGSRDGSTLFQTSPSATAIPFTAVNKVTLGGTPLKLDGLLYNLKDNYLYGLNDNGFTGSPTLYRLDANGNAQTIANIPVPSEPLSYTNQFTLPVPIVPSATIKNTQQAVFANITTASEDGKAYLLATAYHFAKLSGVDYEVLEYNLYVAEINLANPSVGISFYEVNLNDPSFGCRNFADNAIFNTIAYYGGFGAKKPALQDWALAPTGDKIWAFDGETDTAIRFELPTTPSVTATAQCYEAQVPNNGATSEVSGLHFAQDGSLYAIDGTTGKTFGINVGQCPPEAVNNCAIIGSTFDLPLVGTPPTNTNLLANSASCVTASSLPVTLLRFVGSNENCNNILRWITGSEQNNNRFEIEKSLDGVRYASIGIVRGVGNSSSAQAYTFTDNNISKTCYYRLRQVDVDGKATVFPTVISLSNNCLKKVKLGVEMAFPNPTINTTTILFNAAPEQIGAATWTLTDVAGRTIAETSTTLQEDGNLLTVDLSKQASGIYFFFIRTADGSVSTMQRLVRR